MRPRPLARTLEWTFVLAAYALPLAVLPGPIADAIEVPKLALLAAVTACFAGIALARRLLWGEAPWPATPLVPPLLAWLGWSALGALGAEAPSPAAEALLYLGALALAALLASSLSGPNAVVQAVLIAAGVTAAYGLGQYVGFEPLPWSSHFKPRIFATLGNPVFLGGYLAVVFPVALARWLATEREETKDLLTLLLGALGVAAYLTWTRSAWLGIAVSSAVILGALAATARGRRQLAANRAWLLTLAGALAVACALTSSTQVLGNSPVPVADRLRDAFNPRGYSFRFRLVTNEVALRVARDRPLLGAGPAGYPIAYPGRRLGTLAARGAPEHFFASQEAYAHDDHAQALAESGVVGLGLWLWLLAVLVRWALARHRAGSWTGLAGLGAAAAFATDGALNFPLRIAPTGWTFFAVAGLLGAGASTPTTGAGAPRGSVRATRAGLAPRWRPAAAAALIAACVALVVKPVADRLTAERFRLEGDRQANSNNYDMAAVYYGIGAEAAPRDRFMQFRLSVALLRTGRFEWRGTALDDSLIRARRAQALGYRDENVHKHLSDVFAGKSAVRKAVGELDRALALHPGRDDIANNLAFYLAESGTRLDEAVRIMRGVASRNPADPTFLDTLGWVELQAGNAGRAVAALRAALAAFPKGSQDPAVLAARREVEEHMLKARRAP